MGLVNYSVCCNETYCKFLDNDKYREYVIYGGSEVVRVLDVL